MENVLYFDCFAGISGDMIVGALLDLGVAEEILRKQLESLQLEGFSLQINKGQKNGIWGTNFRVLLDQNAEHHGHGHHHHEHRGLKEIETLIKKSSLTENVKIRSMVIFEKIALAEAKIHGISPEEVHFHEVGAIDSIVDVVAACICFETLNIDHVYSSPLHVGEGFVHCAHGLLPVPAPAVLEILKEVPVYTTGLKAELVTPTGAAVITNLAEQFGPIPEIVVEAIGYGLGDRNLDIPNMLRVIKARK